MNPVTKRRRQRNAQSRDGFTEFNRKHDSSFIPTIPWGGA
jgi:hypothetical protein